jgi:hypothetical protein
VIDANASVSKIYFDPRTPFEPGGDNSNPPICWSDNGIGASAQASQPQNTSCQLCPQAAWNGFASIVLPHVGAGEDEMLVCGMALGYADDSEIVNTFRTPREPVTAFTRWLD